MSEQDMTTNQDYRWKWLATVIVLLYSLGFPLWIIGSTIFSYTIGIDGVLMSTMVLVWISCFVYTIGPENIKAAKELKTK